MSALGLGQLMQHGLVQGAGLYTQGAELSMAREQQQQRQAALAQELADRRQRASMLLRSQEATTNVLKALTQPAPVGMDGRPVPVHQIVNPADLADADPGIQQLVTRGMADQMKLSQDFERATKQYQAAQTSGMTKYVSPRTIEEWMQAGVQVDPNHLPLDMAARSEDTRSARRAAMIDLMTILPARDGMGPPGVDQASRQQLEAMPLEGVEIVFERWKQEEGRKQKYEQMQMDIDQLQASYIAAGAPPERARGLAVQAAMNAPLLYRQPGTGDQLADNRATLELRMAEEALKVAKAQYEAINVKMGGGKQIKMGLMPPSPDEIAAASKPRDTGYTLIPWSGTSEGDYAQLQAKTAAWQKYKDAERNLLMAGEKARAMLAGGAQQVQGGGAAGAPQAAGQAAPAAPQGGPPSQVDTLIDQMIQQGMNDQQIEAELKRRGLQ